MRRSEELAMAVSHVRDGETRVRKQEALVDKLQAAGHPIEQAIELLKTLNTTLDLMRDHLHAIEVEIEAERRVRIRARRLRVKAASRSI